MPPDDEPRANRLAQETSAYLRQHMHNPVDWFPWGDEALERARAEDKPLLVSIGYSACHWCHVMEHESFEDAETAALMNRLYVNVKVDREERPDVDQVYMDTVTGLLGHGGWPLTVFCKPDGTPYYGGTYFPPEPRHGMPAFRQVLVAVEEAYRSRRDEVEQASQQILAALSRRPEGRAGQEPGTETLRQAAMRLLQRADDQHGGFGSAPKFPTPAYLFTLLAACDVLPERKAREALDHVRLTCREMSRGGVYDQLGGAFHRYSVDAQWGVPHFEKMLYDQGQLLSVYVEAWRRGGADDDDLLWPVHETVGFLDRAMSGPEGGFYASLDADSEGEEGTFYVWTPAQVEAVLGAERAADFCAAYGVTERGNFEQGTTVLRDAAREPRERRADAREALLMAREKRPAPGTDRKRVASWNALAISGLARAAGVLGDDELLTRAEGAARFLLEHMVDGSGRLLRVWAEGAAKVPAFLDDHAALLEALLDLHRAGAGGDMLPRALGFADEIVARFYDESEGDLYLSPCDGDALVLRPRTDHDGAMPHSTGLATLGLLRAAGVSGRGDLRQVAERVIASHAFVLDRAPEAYPTLARACALAAHGTSVAVVVGDPEAEATRALAARARRVLAPEDAVVVATPGDTPAGVDPSWLVGREPADGRPTAYVCRGVTCSLPITEPDALVPLAVDAAD
ncbi:MAG: thioredoxin domain-containing protein [Myxococcota bacterium]|nr:thioredoxin domain-containing protein [Myxococcota bacterium]